jgi:serine/threonine-protein kinase RsbW
VAQVLQGWGAPSEVVSTLKLGVSELLTNVHIHVGDPRWRLELGLAVRRNGSRVRLVVQDGSPVLPTVCEPDWARDSGRGLWLLREMAEDFGCEAVAGGKRVWIGCDYGGIRP